MTAWPTSDPWTGRRVDRCRIERPFGRGGHAQIYLAFDEELRERRVLKIALPGLNEEELRGFLDEGLILSRLKHPQIVTLRSQGEFEGRRYMLLDFIEGHSLRDLLSRCVARLESFGDSWARVLPPPVATALALSASRALAYAHAAHLRLPDREIHGLAHRDISPGNLILGSRGDERGRVALIDFGTAKTDLESLHTLRQNLSGTVPYMSKARLQRTAASGRLPGSESFWKGFRDTRHDVHALGAVYYQLLTGTPPFPGESAPQIITRILDRDDYARLVPTADAALSGAGAIIGRCVVWHDLGKSWQEQPEQFSDARALSAALENLFRRLSPDRGPEQVLADYLTASTALLADPEPAAAPIANVSPAAAFPSVPPPLPKADSKRLALIFFVGIFLLAGTIIAYRKPWTHHSQAVTSETTLHPAPAMPASTVPLEPVAAAHTSPDKHAIRRRKSGASRPAQAVATETPPVATALDAQTFDNLQAEVRTDPHNALADLAAAKKHDRESSDLDFLQCEAQAALALWTPELKQSIQSLLPEHPAFLDIRLFRENLSYWLWRTNLALYQQHPDDASVRQSLARSANAYLTEFGKNPALRAKITGVQTSETPPSP